MYFFETTELFTSTAPFSIRLTAAERDKSIFASEINLSSLTPLVSQLSLNSFIAFVDLFFGFHNIREKQNINDKKYCSDCNAVVGKVTNRGKE